MQEQRTRARASWKGAHKEAASPAYRKLAETFKTEPDFYHGTQTRDARIEGIVTKQGAVNEIKAGDEAEIVLDRTSIYSESGGQVADTGAFYDNDMSLQVADVKGAYYPVSGLIAHRIVAKEDLARRRPRRYGCRSATPRARHAQSHRDAPDARSVAQYPRHSCEAGRLARRARSLAFRFFALRVRRRERTRRNRAAGERRNSARSRALDRHYEHRRRARLPARSHFSATSTPSQMSAS